jgi:hypothetical protein
MDEGPLGRSSPAQRLVGLVYLGAVCGALRDHGVATFPNPPDRGARMRSFIE